MPDSDTLHDLVLTYRRSGEGRDRILEKVAAKVYRSHRRLGFDDEDSASFVMERYRRRIGKLIDRFEDRGVPFDSYLNYYLKYFARTARRTSKKARDMEMICERAAYADSARSPLDYYSYGQPSEASASISIRPPPGRSESERATDRRKKPSGRRPRARSGRLSRPAEREAYSSRLVFLAIKCAWEIDAERLSSVASAAGVDPDWLAAAVDQARRSLASESVRIGHLIERRNAAWCRRRYLESRLAVETDSYRRERILTAIAREKARLDRVRAELETLRTVVPNSVVARIVGVPKGTVDSGLFYLKKMFGAGLRRESADRPACGDRADEAIVSQPWN